MDMSHDGEQRRGEKRRAFTLNSESHSSTTLRSEPSIFLRDPPSAAWCKDEHRGDMGGGSKANS